MGDRSRFGISEIGVQWGVALYKYDVREIDLSRCRDKAEHIKSITWGKLRETEELRPVADAIRRGGDSQANDSSLVAVYSVNGDGEEYEIYVPEWWA